MRTGGRSSGEAWGNTVLKGHKRGRGDLWCSIRRGRSQRVQSGADTERGCESRGGDLARQAGYGSGSCSQMIRAGRGSNLVKVGGTEHDFDALQTP